MDVHEFDSSPFWVIVFYAYWTLCSTSYTHIEITALKKQTNKTKQKTNKILFFRIKKVNKYKNQTKQLYREWQKLQCFPINHLSVRVIHT